MRLPAATLIGLVLLATGGDARAQAPASPRPGALRVSVRDATDLPIAAAAITLTAVTAAGDPGGPPDAVQYTAVSNDRGDATFEGVRPGTYTGHVESPGFIAAAIERLAIRAGARVNREVTLQVAGFVEELDVTPAADDQRLANSFTDQLTSDQLAALPEDPEELAIVLQQLLGDDADIRVDGFSGGRLPPGTQIQEVRIRYDGGSASSGGGPRVEIRTMPGGDRWRTNASLNVRDESLDARNAFSGERPVGQTRQYGWNLNGPLIKNRTGFSLSIDGSDSMENQTIRAATPGGLYRNLIEQPSSRIGVWTRLEHQINPAQTVRVDFRRNADDAHNQGLGEFDLPERAFSREGSSGELRLGHHATVRRRYVNDFRLTYGWNSTESVSASNERTVRVLDAFTSGGAQLQGGRRSRSIEVENELEFTLRRLHQITASARVEGADYQGDEYRNASGTYTFSSLESLAAGLPTTFTQRVGDPAYRYSMYRFGWHLQDDYRMRRNLMINIGLRHDFQTHMKDWANFSPRVGANWTPSSKTRTTLRGSVGIFHSQLDAATYQQTLLVNGLQQRDLVITSPGYPDPFSVGVAEAASSPSIIRARADLQVPFNRRYSIGVDQPIGKLFRLRATFSHQTGHHIFRSRDANAPVDGIRPDPSVRNITELETTARSLNKSLEMDLAANYPPRRFSANLNYVFGKAMGETDGAFALPPDNFDLSGEWGPARNDVRHRVNAGMNSDLPGRFRINANFRAQTASPYNITTGTDANRDGVNNERPAGVSRNTGRGAGTKNLDLTLTWGLSLGQRQGVDTPRGGSPGAQRSGGPRPAAARNNEMFRFEVFARSTNALNIANAQNFSGVLTSPFFGRPTSAAAARRIVVGTRVWF
jgi:hypothetical protein